MEQLIRELYQPSHQSSSERINEIQKQIQQLQRERSAWRQAVDLLHNGDDTIRFYGALTLTIKINADWDRDGLGDNENVRSSLLEALVGNYIRLVNLPDSRFVLQKLGSTLVSFFAKPDSSWSLPFRQVLACFLSENYVFEENLPEMGQLLEASKDRSDSVLEGVLLLATIMAEDLNNRSSSALDKGRLNDRVAANSLDVWLLLRYCIKLVIGQQQAEAAPEQARAQLRDILQLAMKAIPYWANMSKYAEDTQAQRSEGIARDCIAATVDFFEDDSYTGSVLQMLISLENSSARLLREALPNFPARLVNSPKAREMVDLLLRGDFISDGVLYVDLLESIMGHIDITKPDFLDNHRYNEVVVTLQRLLSCKGVAVIEDPVCQVVLERIGEIIEGYIDWEDDNEPARLFLKGVTVRVCEACLLKIRIPPEEMSSETQSWDADDRAKFQDFRFDVQDFFHSAYMVLGNALIEEIVANILGHGASPDWSIFEASTFSLLAFSDTMTANPDKYDTIITTVLGSPAWSYLLQTADNVPDRALRTAIKFIAENVAYLQRHPDRLVAILNFLFSSLHLQASTTAASRAIYNLCDFHRSTLGEGLPQFIDSLVSIGDIGETERHRIYAAVAAIIQALPTEEAKVEPLSRLLSPVGHAFTILDGNNIDKADILRGCIDIMQTLASIGKGLRSPADVPVDLEASSASTSDFWTSGQGAIVQQNVLAMYHAILQKVRPYIDSVFVDACCDFIKSGFTEEHPSPFKFTDLIGLELVNHFINLDNPSIDNTMACASSFLASVSKKNLQASVSGLLYAVISNQRLILSTYHETKQLPNNDFLSSSLDFLSRLLNKCAPMWFGMQDSQDTAAVSVEMGLLVMADSDTLPRRSAAGFFAALAESSGPENGFDSEANARVKGLLQDFGPRILSLVLRLLGGECARSEIDSLTETLKRFEQKQAMLSKAVLREAVKEETGVMSEKALNATTLERRNRFVSQVATLRGARKTNEIVKDFWIDCRGSGFGYIA
ncbi:uncharacterized protein Z520_09992 [Fonsecaea multimorphosa CBS 102226]|uniref:Importin N-terminal domain-containing protein n=1 Tax=Fonsecaea multimorphosa CBS 102226 TaxID=1442371 RepID=A0A0D2JLS5_9EURO|nr:uncharacterized protein Z520_09992 [Fonsecaea multimorphosa CBS 102226]KIX94282.1 hypothetical protein Z520_09992 [Fonsecaea multimorphosa CBS 102226]OAL19963.1 hypothetical protein AYO22_09490 [Fonsecaea multimorphosa]